MGKKVIEDKIIEECGHLLQKFKSYEGKQQAQAYKGFKVTGMNKIDLLYECYCVIIK